jgi:hypothetical protein
MTRRASYRRAYGQHLRAAQVARLRGNLDQVLAALDAHVERCERERAHQLLGACVLGLVLLPLEVLL